MIELVGTNSAAIAAEFVRARRKSGSPAMGMVMTVVVVVEDQESDTAMAMAKVASYEHPARVLGVILGDGRGAPQVDAQVGIGSGWTGEIALIRLSGRVVKHPESVVLPLLLPDSPVAVWWPTDAPADPAADPLGRLAQRRITDSAMVTRGKARALLTQCRAYTPGNTDLAWTRLTAWRALLAAALDQHRVKVTAGRVVGERISPSADLLVAWLADRLKVPVERVNSRGPGITEVTLGDGGRPDRDHPTGRQAGDVLLPRPPGPPDRTPAPRGRASCSPRSCARLDEDNVYASVARRLAKARS